MPVRLLMSVRLLACRLASFVCLCLLVCLPVLPVCLSACLFCLCCHLHAHLLSPSVYRSVCLNVGLPLLSIYLHVCSSVCSVCRSCLPLSHVAPRPACALALTVLLACSSRSSSIVRSASGCSSATSAERSNRRVLIATALKSSSRS